MNLENLQKNLTATGYTVRVFDTAAQAAEYLVESIHGKTVGIGGSMTIDAMDVYDRLAQDNQVFWHWKTPGPETLAKAAQAQVYLSSVNGIAETGEIINIDGTGNRVAETVYGHEQVYFIVGKNKLAPDYEQALWRARNIAAPKNAQRLNCKTPCAAEGDRCYDCKSPARICRALSVLWRPPLGARYEVVLVKQELGY